MNLHRALDADWEKVAADKRTRLQRIAAASQGYASPGNAITLFGLVLVIAGLHAILQKHLMLGVLLVGFGRLADLADGVVADRTGTKSPVGEAFDATVDKLELFLAIIVLFFSPYGSRLLIGLLLIHIAVNASLFGLAKSRGVQVHPTQAGKLGTATAWISAGLFVLSKADIFHVSAVLHTVALLCTGVFAVLAAISAVQYYNQLRHHDSI